MSLTAKLIQVLKINGLIVEGSLSTEQSLSLVSGQLCMVLDKTVADNAGTATLWATGDGGLASFSHGFVFSDQDLLLEVSTGEPDYCLLEVKANVLTAVPAFILGSTSSVIGGSLLVAGTDYHAVEAVKAQRNVADGAGDATVDLFLFV